MSKSFIKNPNLAIVAVIVFVFIGASVYDAFTRNPVNRSADAGGASSVSGQIESATPDATQPGQPTANDNTPSAAQTQQQAAAAYNQTNDPASATQNGNNSAGTTTGDATSAAPSQQATPAAPASPAPGTSASTAQNSTRQPDAPASPSGATTSSGAAPSSDFSNSAKPAIRTNPDLRAVIPPVPTAPPRAEGTAPPNTSSQDMYNATDSGVDDGSISDSFPAPVSNFPAPVTPGANPGASGNNVPGGNSDEQQRLQQLRNQKEQLRRDLGF